MSDLKDIKQKEFVVVIDNKEYKSAFTYESIEMLETLSGKAIDEIYPKLTGMKLFLKEKLVLIKAFLVKNYPDFDETALTKQQDFIKKINDIVYSENFFYAFIDPFLAPKITEELPEDENAKEEKKQNSTGLSGQKSTQ